MRATYVRINPAPLIVCVGLVLSSCSEPQRDSDRVVYCKTAVEAVAYNPTDMTYVSVEETNLPEGVWVDIEFDDLNKYGAKQRRRANCEFGEEDLMTDVTVDGEILIPELVRNLNAAALLKFVNRMIEELQNR